MTNKKEQIEEAEKYMQPGYFQHAVSRFEALGMTEKVKEASLACAIDCLDAKRYAFAIKYLEKAEKKDIASRVKKICSSYCFSPSEDLEMRTCMIGICPEYTNGAMNVSESVEMKSLVEKLKEK